MAEEYVFKPWHIIAFEIDDDSNDYLVCVYANTGHVQLEPEERKLRRLFTMKFESQDQCWNFFGMNAHTIYCILKAQGKI